MNNQKGDKLLFRVMNPDGCGNGCAFFDASMENNCSHGFPEQVCIDYNTPEGKWQVLEFVTEKTRWWESFLAEQKVFCIMGNIRTVDEGLYRKLITSLNFIPDLQQHLARFIVERRDEPCDCMKELRACPTCHGSGLRWSPEVVALAEEVVK